MIAQLSDADLRSAIRFLRGGTELNERRASQLLSDDSSMP